MSEDIKELNIKKLYRSREDRMIFGVCGGMAKYFDADSTLIRVIFILLVFANGIGLVMYFIFAILIPLEPGIVDESKTEESKQLISQLKKENKYMSKIIFGIILILIGLFFVLDRYFPISFYMRWLSIKSLWPYIIIILGLYLVFKNTKIK